MKCLINLSIYISLLIPSNLIFSQSFKEVVEFHENGQPKTENVKNLDLKITRINTYDINGRLIEFVSYDPETGIKDGKFMQGSNNGFYENGELNCKNCTIVTEDNSSQTLFEGEFKNGKPYGNIKVYSLVQRVKLQNDPYTSYLLSLTHGQRINYSSYVGTGIYDKNLIYELYYDEKGRLEGNFKISSLTNLVYKNGQIDELYTLNKENRYIYKDSIGRDFKIWKINNRYHKNIGWLASLSWNEYRGDTDVNVAYPENMDGYQFNVFFGNENTSYTDRAPLLGYSSVGYGRLRSNGLYERSLLQIGSDYYTGEINISDLFFQIPMTKKFSPFTSNSDILLHYNLDEFIGYMEVNYENYASYKEYWILKKLRDITNSFDYGDEKAFSTFDFYNIIQDYIDSVFIEVYLVDADEVFNSSDNAKYKSYRTIHAPLVSKMKEFENQKRRAEKEILNADVDFVLNKYIEFLGGEELIKKIQSNWRQKESLIFSPENNKYFKSTVRNSKRQYYKLTNQSSESGKITGDYSDITLVNFGESKYMRQINDQFQESLLSDKQLEWFNRYGYVLEINKSKFNYLGVENILVGDEMEKCYKVSLDDKIIFYSTLDYRKVRTEGKNESGESVIVDYFDYKKFKGFNHFTKSTIKINGKVTLSEQVSFDYGIEDNEIFVYDKIKNRFKMMNLDDPIKFDLDRDKFLLWLTSDKKENKERYSKDLLRSAEGISGCIKFQKLEHPDDYKIFYYNKLFFNNISSLEAHSSRMLEVQGLEYYERTEVDLDNLTILIRTER